MQDNVTLLTAFLGDIVSIAWPDPTVAVQDNYISVGVRKTACMAPAHCVLF